MDTRTRTDINPIKVAVIDHRLDAISKDIGLTLLRTSRSPIFSDARDFATAIFDSEQRLVAQTAYIPVLMGALPYALRSIAETFADDIADGDVFILNDPYRGNNHPPDITIAKPVFHHGELEFWVTFARGAVLSVMSHTASRSLWTRKNRSISPRLSPRCT